MSKEYLERMYKNEGRRKNYLYKATINEEPIWICKICHQPLSVHLPMNTQCNNIDFPPDISKFNDNVDCDICGFAGMCHNMVRSPWAALRYYLSPASSSKVKPPKGTKYKQEPTAEDNILLLEDQRQNLALNDIHKEKQS